MIKITESPRDGMQSFSRIISLSDKIEYLNLLMHVGFDVVDVGSFVSERAVPQMADTEKLIENISVDSDTQLSVLVGNARYAERAVLSDKIHFINYPFAISETFLQKNLRSDFQKSYAEIDTILNLCDKYHKQAVVTLSMAFGNPYGDAFSEDVLFQHIEQLRSRGLRFIPLADTTAEADWSLINELMAAVVLTFPDVEFNLHLHTLPEDIPAKLNAAFYGGCRNFDTVLGGIGGCPMSGKSLTANVDTLKLVAWADETGISHNLNLEKLEEASRFAKRIFV